MSDEEIKHRIREIEHEIIFSRTRLNYLFQLLELIKEKNRIIFRYEGFYAMAHRDFSANAILAARKLVEPGDKTHNINTLVAALKTTRFYKNNKSELDPILEDLLRLSKSKIAQDSTIIASTNYAHKSLKLPKKDVVVKFEDLHEWLGKVGEQINKISGFFWGSSVLMEMPDSQDDSFKREMIHMERAEIAGSHLLIIDESHTAVSYADKLMKRKLAEGEAE